MSAYGKYHVHEWYVAALFHVREKWEKTFLLGKRVVKAGSPARIDGCPHSPSHKQIISQLTLGEFNWLVNKTRKGE